MKTSNDILQNFCVTKVITFFEVYHRIAGKTLICDVTQTDNKLHGVSQLSDNKRCSEIRVHTNISTIILYDGVEKNKIGEVYYDIIEDVINLAYDNRKYILVVDLDDPDYIDITVTSADGNSCTWCV